MLLMMRCFMNKSENTLGHCNICRRFVDSKYIGSCSTTTCVRESTKNTPQYWINCAMDELNGVDERECSKEAWDFICNAKEFLS